MATLLFLVLVVITFIVVYTTTRPSRQEADLGRRLAGIDVDSAAGRDISADIMKREVYSGNPLFNTILQRLKASGALNTLIRQADLRWNVSMVLLGSVVLFFAATLLGRKMLHSFLLGFLVGVAAGLAPYLYLRFRRAARLRRFAALLPEAIDLLSRALRAGHALTAAIEMVAREVADPVGTEFRRTFEEQNFGLPLREALLNLANRIPVADLHFLVTAMLVQKETGGNLAEVLDKTGHVIRERTRLLGQLRIYTAQGRMTGWILGVLPFLVFAALNFLSPSYTHVMLDDPAGRHWILIGLGLMCIGVYLIRRIVDIKV
jgi:tight adherence protein B